MKTMNERAIAFFERVRGMDTDHSDDIPGHTEECVIDGVHYVVMADNRGECYASLAAEEHNYVS